MVSKASIDRKYTSVRVVAQLTANKSQAHSLAEADINNKLLDDRQEAVS